MGDVPFSVCAFTTITSPRVSSVGLKSKLMVSLAELTLF